LNTKKKKPERTKDSTIENNHIRVTQIPKMEWLTY